MSSLEIKVTLRLEVAFFRTFGRTGFRISISGAKFDPEVEFEVHLLIAPPNPCEKL